MKTISFKTRKGRFLDAINNNRYPLIFSVNPPLSFNKPQFTKYLHQEL